MTALRKATGLEAKSIFFISNQMEGFSQISKKFEKTMYDHAMSFYKD